MENTKICMKCNRSFPMNNIYFFSRSKSKDGFSSRCKECLGYKFKDTKITLSIPNYIICTKCGNKLPATTKYFRKQSNVVYGLRKICKECDKKRWKEYYSKNQEYLKERSKINSSERHRSYYIKNKDKCIKARIEYRMKNLDKYRIYAQKRIARKRKLIRTLTNYEWIKCLDYFDNKDAYTGLDMIVPTQDHVIPLSKGGAYVKQNIVPCEMSINSSKNNSDMETWYRKQPFFSQERLDKIYSWMEVKKDKQQLKFI